MAQFGGQLVIVKLQDLTGGNYNKFKGLISSGESIGRDCYIAYRGNPEKLAGKNAIVRLDPPNRAYLDLTIPNAHFVTTTIPDDFDYAASDEVILYGIWEQRMPKKLKAPYLLELTEFFNLVNIVSALHYSMEDGIITPYRTFRNNIPEPMTNDFGSRPPGNALQRYLNRIADYLWDVRIVTMEENEHLEYLVLSEFDKIIRSPGFRINRSLKMEPQQ